jgi:hypothetical protein
MPAISDDLDEAKPTVISFTREKPHCRGWWARRWNDRVAWFFVERLDEMGLAVWLDVVEDFESIDRLTRPGTTWAGPLVMLSTNGSEVE